MATVPFQCKSVTRTAHQRLGISLIDVMLSVVLLSAAFMAAISSLPLIFDAQRRAEESEPATTVALQVMELNRIQAFSAIAPYSGSSTALITSNGVQRQAQYAYSVDVTSLTNDLKDVTVTVTWSYHGQGRSEVLESKICGAAGAAGQL